MKVNVSDEEILNAVSQSITMAEAASRLGIHFNTFARLANKLGVYKPNPGGKGKRKSKREGFGKISLNEILEGKHPTYQTFKLKGRLYSAGIKSNKCEKCGTDSWNGQPLMCELDHINGNSRDHRLENLQILCPNCHSQTDTFRAKNKSKCM